MSAGGPEASPIVTSLYARLVTIARSGAFISYETLSETGDPDDAALRRQLDDVALLCRERGQPLLPALVVNPDYQLPGRHFFEVASRCGVYRGPAVRDQVTRWWARYTEHVRLYWRDPA